MRLLLLLGPVVVLGIAFVALRPTRQDPLLELLPKLEEDEASLDLETLRLRYGFARNYDTLNRLARRIAEARIGLPGALGRDGREADAGIQAAFERYRLLSVQ